MIWFLFRIHINRFILVSILYLYSIIYSCQTAESPINERLRHFLKLTGIQCMQLVYQCLTMKTNYCHCCLIYKPRHVPIYNIGINLKLCFLSSWNNKIVRDASNQVLIHITYGTHILCSHIILVHYNSIPVTYIDTSLYFFTLV